MSLSQGAVLGVIFRAFKRQISRMTEGSPSGAPLGIIRKSISCVIPYSLCFRDLSAGAAQGTNCSGTSQLLDPMRLQRELANLLVFVCIFPLIAMGVCLCVHMKALVVSKSPLRPCQGGREQ